MRDIATCHNVLPPDHTQIFLPGSITELERTQSQDHLHAANSISLCHYSYCSSSIKISGPSVKYWAEVEKKRMPVLLSPTTHLMWEKVLSCLRLPLLAPITLGSHHYNICLINECFLFFFISVSIFFFMRNRDKYDYP